MVKKNGIKCLQLAPFGFYGLDDTNSHKFYAGFKEINLLSGKFVR